MRKRRAVDRVSGADLSAHTCARCGGAWLPRAGLAAVFPGLAAGAASTDDRLLCPECGAVAPCSPAGAVERFVCPAGCGSFVEASSVLALAHERRRRHGGDAGLEGVGGYRERPRPAGASGGVPCAGCSRALDAGDTLMTRFGPQCAACRSSLAVQVRLGGRRWEPRKIEGPNGETLIVCSGCGVTVPHSPLTLGECDACFLVGRLEHAAEEALLDASLSPRRRRARKWYDDTLRPMERTWRRWERRLRRAWRKLG
jgi:hypothetical protein